MKLRLLFASCFGMLPHQRLSRSNKLLRSLSFVLLLVMFCATRLLAQGSWVPVTSLAPDPNGGVMLLLPDGSVICKSFAGGDTYGNVWDRLTPDSKGSYVNGTWSKIKPMLNSRLYFSSQVLMDGRVYVSGGEYGSGGFSSEVYDPLTNTWTAAPAPGGFISDANSEILPDGKVLQALVNGTLRNNKIYNPLTNTYATGPACIGIHNECTWVKLPDNSILMVDRLSRNSERYIPSLNQWVADGNVPVDLYDPFGLETGAGLLLPDGRAFFIGSPGHTAYYTPSGNNSPGVWTAGPDIPGGKGQADAPAAMMVNGKILLTAAPKPVSGNVFRTPTSFYEFDYRTNVFTQLNGPAGVPTANVPVYVTIMLDLPDGSVLFSYQDSNRYYVYKPVGHLPAAAKPVISNITKNASGDSYTITGTLFNGISEGACYGDDWQMATNYPIIRLKDPSNGNVYYAQTYNWNSTGVRRGGKKDTSQFRLPAGLPVKAYSLVVTANGIASQPVSFTPGVSATSAVIAVASNPDMMLQVSPNPATSFTRVSFRLDAAAQVQVKVYDMNGVEKFALAGKQFAAGMQSVAINTSGLKPGTYFVRVITEKGTGNIQLIVN